MVFKLIKLEERTLFKFEARNSGKLVWIMLDDVSSRNSLAFSLKNIFILYALSQYILHTVNNMTIIIHFELSQPE